MPLTGQQPDIADFLSRYLSTLPAKPKAILVATAHWETKTTTVLAGEQHPLLFDYGGFPPETYRYKYPAAGSPELAKRVQTLLGDAGLPCNTDSKRGWDHGVFVPLMLLNPDASIPVVAMSLLDSQDATATMKVGQALQPLRDEGVLIIGSGVSFHNLQVLFAQGSVKQKGIEASVSFDNWLREAVTSDKLNDAERTDLMASWEKTPGARIAHPHNAAEHLMPLFLVYGAAGCGPAGRPVGLEPADGVLGGFRISQFEFA